MQKRVVKKIHCSFLLDVPWGESFCNGVRDPLEVYIGGKLCLKPLHDTEVILHSERRGKKTGCKNKRGRGRSEKEILG